METTYERASAFEDRFAIAQATTVVNLPWGFALLQKDFPLTHSHNRLVVTSPVSAAEVTATADEVLGAAGVTHRFIGAQGDSIGQALRPDMLAAGYEHEPIATMEYNGPRVEPGQPQVESVSFETLRPAIIRDWKLDLPNGTQEEFAQLADRTTLYAKGAEHTRLVVIEGGEVASRADLYVDRQSRIAQFENLVTHPDYRGHGNAQALVEDALWRAQVATCELTFLTADVHDWPYEWYERLGFVEVGRSHFFTRMPA